MPATERGTTHARRSTDRRNPAEDPGAAVTGGWLVGSLVPLAASFLRTRSRSVSGLFPTRTVPGVTGLVASFAVVQGLPMLYHGM